MFNNLKAEMVRTQITNTEIADYLGINERTLRNYINGHSKMPLKVALMIRDKYFPELSLEYLFENRTAFKK